MKRKGFAITGILYVLLIIFLASMTMLLFNLQNRKMILDQLKLDVVEAVESDNNYEYLLNKISDLESKIGNTSLLNGTIVENIEMIKSDFTLSNREIIHKEFTFPHSELQTIYAFTAPKDGLYLFSGGIHYASNSSGIRSVNMSISGLPEINLQIGASPSYWTHLPISASHYLKQGENVVFTANQTSGTSLTVTFDLLIESS